jgi:hypothetical protein
MLDYLKIKKWPFAPDLPDSHETRANLARRVSFFSKSALANVASLAKIKSQHFGKFVEFG